MSDMIDDATMKVLVNRFLAWKLPENFRPDAGISFKAEYNDSPAAMATLGIDKPMRHEPTGTNLFDATQAEAMLRHVLAALTTPSPSSEYAVPDGFALVPRKWTKEMLGVYHNREEYRKGPTLFVSDWWSAFLDAAALTAQPQEGVVFRGAPKNPGGDAETSKNCKVCGLVKTPRRNCVAHRAFHQLNCPYKKQAPQEGVAPDGLPAGLPKAICDAAAEYYCKEFGWDHDQASYIFSIAYRGAMLAAAPKEAK